MVVGLDSVAHLVRNKLLLLHLDLPNLFLTLLNLPHFLKVPIVLIHLRLERGKEPTTTAYLVIAALVWRETHLILDKGSL